MGEDHIDRILQDVFTRTRADERAATLREVARMVDARQAKHAAKALNGKTPAVDRILAKEAHAIAAAIRRMIPTHPGEQGAG